jgi:hypothetical protein
MAGVFSSQAARDGRVLRRKLTHVDRYVGRDAFYAELARRGFHAVENAGQVIIFCNQEPVRVIL